MKGKYGGEIEWWHAWWQMQLGDSKTTGARYLLQTFWNVNVLVLVLNFGSCICYFQFFMSCVLGFSIISLHLSLAVFGVPSCFPLSSPLVSVLLLTSSLCSFPHWLSVLPWLVSPVSVNLPFFVYKRGLPGFHVSVSSVFCLLWIAHFLDWVLSWPLIFKTLLVCLKLVVKVNVLVNLLSFKKWGEKIRHSWPVLA